MGIRRFKKYAIGAAGMLVLVVAVVLATGSGSAVAAQITNVFVTNDAAHPVPVHEQGMANVNIANTSLPSNKGRLIHVAHDLTVGCCTTTPWFDTSDCQRIADFVRWTTDPAVHILELSADGQSLDGQATPSGSSLNTRFYDGGVVAPSMRLEFASGGGDAHIADAWIYCTTG